MSHIPDAPEGYRHELVRIATPAASAPDTRGTAMYWHRPRWHWWPRLGYTANGFHGTTYHWVYLFFVTFCWETYIHEQD